MKNRKIKSNEASKGQPQNRSLPEELASLFLRTAEYKRNGGNFDINETLKYVNSCIRLFAKYISEKDVKNALTVQVLLDHAYYNLGLGKPLYLKWAARRGGRANKVKSGIWTALEKYLSERKTITPLRMWKLFETRHSSYDEGGENVYKTPDLCYKVWFTRDATDDKRKGGLLIQESFEGKESSIRFKTFERYVYKIRNKIEPPQA